MSNPNSQRNEAVKNKGRGSSFQQPNTNQKVGRGAPLKSSQSPSPKRVYNQSIDERQNSQRQYQRSNSNQSSNFVPEQEQIIITDNHPQYAQFNPPYAIAPTHIPAQPYLPPSQLPPGQPLHPSGIANVPRVTAYAPAYNSTSHVAQSPAMPAVPTVRITPGQMPMRQPQNSVGVAPPTNPSQINPQVHPTTTSPVQPPIITYQPAHPASQTNQTPVAAQPNDSTRSALPIHSTTTPSQSNAQPQPQSKPTQPGAPSFSSFEEIPRAKSAPPSLQEQDKRTAPTFVPHHYYYPYYYSPYSYQAMQYPPPPQQQQQQQPQPSVQSRPSKRIPIIDPETQSEISSAPPAKPRTNVNNNNNPPTATNSNATKQSVAMFPEIPQVTKPATDEKETTSQTSQSVPSQENSKDSASTKQAKKDDGNSKSLALDANNKDTPVKSEAIGKSANEKDVSEKEPEKEKEDDWESKDENELMNLRKATPTPESSRAILSDFAAPIKTISYPSSLWRPDNLQGSKQYDRNFLLQFQEVCKEKPESMVLLDDYSRELDSSKNSQNWRSSGGAAGQKSGGQQRLQRTGSENNFSIRNSNGAVGNTFRPGLQKSREMPGRRPPIKKSLKPGQPASDVSPLVATEGRWEPPRMTKPVSEEELIQRKVNGILNKLTEEKFDSLSDKLLNVGITSVSILEGIIKSVFDKALVEPKFCAMYSQLCKKLAEHCPDFPSPDGSAKKQFTFKRLLLNRCQEEFESSFHGGNAKKEELEKKYAATQTKEEQVQIEEELWLVKKRMFGNITFIGELYKMGMLTEKIMHECLRRLLGDITDPSVDDVEALCKLMTSIGAHIDHAKAKGYMDAYFQRISDLSQSKSLPSRIRFMLQDLIRLRKSNWVSRQERKAKQESIANKTILSKTPTAAPMRTNDRAPAARAPAPTTTKTPANTGEWEVVASKSKGRFSQSVDSKEDVKLRPQSFGPSSSLGQGAKGWSTSRSSLSEDKNAPKTVLLRPPSIDSDKKVADKSKQIMKSLSEEDVTSPSEEIDSEMDILLEEFLSSADLKEAVQCIVDLNADLGLVISKIIMFSLDKKSKEQRELFPLLSELEASSVASPQQFVIGFKEVLQQLEDLAIDIPSAPAVVSNMLALCLSESILSFAHLQELFAEPSLVNSKGNGTQSADILVQVFNNLLEEVNENDIRQMLADSNFDVFVCFPPEQRNTSSISKFFEDRDLKVLFPVICYGDHLKSLLEEKNVDVEKVKYWVEENISQEILLDQLFCSFVFRTILSSIIFRVYGGKPQNTKSANEETIAKESSVIESFAPLFDIFSSNKQLQLLLLSEAEAVCKNYNFPEGLLERFFNNFFELQLVAVSVFLTWFSDETIPKSEVSLKQLSKWQEDLEQAQDQEVQEEETE